MADKILSAPVVFFSGLDRTGKSTTRKKFSQVTNQKYITFDRSPIDNVVYDEMFRQELVTQGGFKELIRKWLKVAPIYVVHMTLSIDEINKRAKNTGEEQYPRGELKSADLLFKRYFRFAEKYGFKVIRVECDGKTVDEVVSEIINKMGGNTK